MSFNEANSTVPATLWYLSPLEEYKTVKPYVINVPQSAIPGGKQTNQVSKPYHDCPIRDMRPTLADFSLDRNGFQVLQGFSSSLDQHMSDFNDMERVRDVYCDEVATRLREMLGAETAMTLGHTVGPCLPMYLTNHTIEGLEP